MDQTNNFLPLLTASCRNGQNLTHKAFDEMPSLTAKRSDGQFPSSRDRGEFLPKRVGLLKFVTVKIVELPKFHTNLPKIPSSSEMSMSKKKSPTKMCPKKTSAEMSSAEKSSCRNVHRAETSTCRNVRPKNS